MPKRNSKYRPNPKRSVNIFGNFGDSLISSVVPRILSLHESGKNSITIYINSRGGDIRCLETLIGLLTTAEARRKRPPIITVVIGIAASAAATLLALGNYSIAYPESLIHFHGVRLSEADDLTMEDAADFAAFLRRKNDAIAMRLVGSVSLRLVFHYSRFRERFSATKKEHPKQSLSDVECFAHCIKKQVSPSAIRIVNKSIERWKEICTLSNTIFPKLNKLKPAGRHAYDAAILREIVRFETNRNRNSSWSLDAVGIAKVVEDYTILRDYYMGEHNRYVDRIVTYFGPAFLTGAEFQEFKKIQNENERKSWMADKVAQRIKPFVYFVASLCRNLQEEENPLTARDAYWLGAVDEVYGTKLPCLREFEERKPARTQNANKPAAPSPSTSEPAPPSGQSVSSS